MADQHLFFLDADQKWDLAYDRNQWMIRRNQGVRKGPTGGLESLHSAIIWKPLSFIGSKKAGLMSFILGKEIELTEVAKAAYDVLPATFLEWLTASEEPEERMAAE